MKLSHKQKSILLISIFGVVFIGSVTGIAIYSSIEAKITFIESGTEGWMSSIMIETNGIRIYIDPYAIGTDYENKKADLIFITHPHEDHYDPTTIEMLSKDTTEFICPSSCSDIITALNATGVIPGDNLTVGGISFYAIPAYNIATANLAHPRENNWVGYIITIGDYHILQTGDTSLIPEYSDIEIPIDVLICPIGWGCSNMGLEGGLSAAQIFKPTYFIPIHYSTYTEELDDFESRIGGFSSDTQVITTKLTLF